ncbi:MAG: serine hydrolase domain-containing protein [Acidimicrobiales bacterium]
MRFFWSSLGGYDGSESDDAARAVTPGRRVLVAAGRFNRRTRVLLVMGVLGAAWLAWDVLTDSGPEHRGDHFDQIDAYVADEAGDSRIPGVSIAIVEDGVVVHARGFGSDGHGDPISADTPFWIGSNTKSVTALAVMQLAEAGLVDLDSPVRQYLPRFSVADDHAGARITVRHLLNQTSGISRSDGLRAVVDADPDESIDDVVAGMADLELNRPVGERFEYANLNSVVLGAVVEAVTGQRWQDYVQANIFDPLAMTNTYTERAAADAAGLTATHRYVFGFPIENDGEHLPGLAPTGYVYASANDLARYLAMYTNGGTLDGSRVLSDEGITGMLTAATNERSFTLQSQEFTARYGAGWFIGPFGVATDARWHQGSLPFFTTWMVLLPDTDQAVVVMINAGNQFEIGGANAAWSRIPLGVVNLLRDSDPPTGTSTARFFIAFDTLAAAVVTVQLWSLARLMTRPATHSIAMTVALLSRELVAAPLVLLGYPTITGGLRWRAAFAFVPDLSLTVAVVAGLALLTGLLRAARLARHRRSPVDEIDLCTEPGPNRAASTTTDAADPARLPVPMRQHR